MVDRLDPLWETGGSMSGCSKNRSDAGNEMIDGLAVVGASRHGPFLSHNRFDNGDNDADREDSARMIVSSHQ
jgi:hypothetical protein